MEPATNDAPKLASEQGILSNAFTTSGRTGRLRYLIYMASYFPLIMLLGLFGPLKVIGIPVVIANYVCATIQRCHDVGLSGWSAVILGLPGANILLMVMPSKGANRYGDPLSSGRKERLIAVLMVILTIAACSVYYFYIFRPALQAYETRNAIGGRAWERMTGASPITKLNFTAPASGEIVIDTDQRISMTYRARYRTVYLSFTLDGNQYLQPMQYNVKSGQLEMTDGDAVVGTYAQH